jgi:gas vesicle protein
MMNDDESSSPGTALLAFAGGALLGAGLALLFAPQSGRKTRRQLAGWAEEAGGYARDLADEASDNMKSAREKGADWLQQAKDYAGEKKTQAAAAFNGNSR